MARERDRVHMRLSQLLRPHTVAAGGLLEKAGYIHRLDDGLNTLLPLGQRVLNKINRLIRTEWEGIGAQELTMPLLQPLSLWERDLGKRSRAEAFGPQLFRVQSQVGEPLVLAPTHEEAAAIVGAACIRDSRDLPRLIYQIQPRFRDRELSPNGGLLRTREFIMADAYSFHVDAGSLNETYEAMKLACIRILSACGTVPCAVSASTGAIGGDASEELIVAVSGAENPAGVQCGACDYAASAEIAGLAAPSRVREPFLEVEEVTEVEAHLRQIPSRRLLWTPFVAGRRVILAVMTSNREALSPAKLARALDASGIDCADLHPATRTELECLGATYEWISLVRTPPSVLVVADAAVENAANFQAPSLRAGHYLTNLNHGRDFRVDLFADLTVVEAGDACPQCMSPLQILRGVEAGHIFKIGQIYSQAFGVQVQGVDGRGAAHMGCYGLGVTRILAAAAQHSRDQDGIVWPLAIAPFSVIVVPRNHQDSPAAEQLYVEMIASGLDVLLDDTNEGDPQLQRADLLGIPFQALPSGHAGNMSTADVVDVRCRRSRRIVRLTVAELVSGRLPTE